MTRRPDSRRCPGLAPAVICITPAILALAMILAVFPAAGCSWLGGVASQVAGNFSTPDTVIGKHAFPGNTRGRLAVQWVGHSTVLVRMDDRVLVTDPFLTPRVGGIKARLVEPGIDLDSLGRLDVILISHSHADHLSLGSLGELEGRFPEADLAFPAGVEEFLPRYRFPLHRLRQADPDSGQLAGETVTIAGVTITTVRSMHWAGRYGFDGSLWKYPGYTGYVIEYHGLTVYYPGDTGYDSTLFRSIGERWSIDLALLPIGPCYDPASIGTPRHVGPVGALRILEDTKARAMVPVHFGTVHEPMDAFDPLQVLRRLLEGRGDLAGVVRVLKIGEQAEFLR